MEYLTMKKKMKILEHIIATTAGAYYSINLTKNLVPGKMYQVIDDKEYSINEQIGMPDNVAFSDVVEYWGSKLDEKEQKGYFEFFNISNLLSQYADGEKHIWHRYWTKTALFEPMLAEQHIVMFDDEETGDVLAVTYVLDQTEELRKQQYSEKMKQKNQELEKMLDMERKYSGIMSALSTIYWQIYSVDLITGTYREVYDGRQFKIENLYKTGMAQDAFQNALYRFVAEDYQAVMNAFLDHKTLSGRLACTDSISADYCTVTGQWLSATYIVQQRDETGKVIKALFTIKDIREQKALEFKQQELLKKAADAAEVANKAKSTFLFNMSHDIRTPMNALLGYNQLMKSELTDPKLLHYQEKIEQAGKLLLSIINNVLDMARIESGKMELDENYSQVGDILEEVCEVFDVEAKKKGISLTYETHVTHKHILCDITKIQKILINLVSNAVKYTPAGGTVTICSEELPCDQAGFVCIKTEVMDNGIGISKDYIPFLFDSFSREHNTTMGKVYGTGLGMSIVKKMVDMMGGSIEVESELGKGSLFTLILQLKIADKKYYEQKSDSTLSVKREVLQGKHILLAEDNELNAEIAITILEEMGLKIDHVEDGVQCVDKIEKMPANTYDLILMDIQMPHMDGYKATEMIRGLQDKEKANIPIVAMTANAFEENRKTAFSKGMNGHIAKPIDVEKVEEALVAVLK